MAIKIEDLVKKLQEKDQNKEVEFIVVATNGDLVSIDIEAQGVAMAKFLKMLGVNEDADN